MDMEWCIEMPRLKSHEIKDPFLEMIKMLVGMHQRVKNTNLALDCVCKGKCDCHLTLLMGVPCPTTCKNYGNHFDGCHRCDCVEKKMGKKDAKTEKK